MSILSKPDAALDFAVLEGSAVDDEPDVCVRGRNVQQHLFIQAENAFETNAILQPDLDRVIERKAKLLREIEVLPAQFPTPSRQPV